MGVRADTVTDPVRRAPWRMLAVLLCGQAMASMDTSIVTVALPSIRDRLPATGAQAQLVAAAYLLTFAAVVVTGARLGDRYGAGRMFRLGLAGFTAASLGCGLAPGAGPLIAARAVQGVAAAVLVPQVVSLIQARFDGPARARAIGLYSMVLAVGVAAGQIAGGLIVSADVAGLGWRPALLVNLPVGLVLLVVAGRLLPADPPPDVARLDMVGVVLLAAAMAAVVGGLTVGREQHWPASWLVVGAAGVVGLLVFGGYERRLPRTGGTPLLDLRALRPAGVPAGLAACFLVMGAYAAFLFALTMHLQGALGFGPLRAGLAFVPFAAGFAAMSLGWTRLPEPAHRALSVAGPLAFAAGATATVLLAGHGWPGGLATILLALAGAGHAASFSPLFARLGQLMGARYGSALAALGNTGALLASALSIAAVGGLYLSVAATPGGSAAGLRAACLAVDAMLLVTAACAARAVTRRPRPDTAPAAGTGTAPAAATGTASADVHGTAPNARR